MARTPLNKSAFILSFPPSVTAKAIVVAGKKKHITITERYVYVTRSAAKAKRRNGVAHKAGNGSTDTALRRAIADVGLARARAVLQEVESAFGG